MTHVSTHPTYTCGIWSFMPDELMQYICKLIEARLDSKLNSDMAQAMFVDLCSISQRVAIAQYGIVALREDDVSIDVYAFGLSLSARPRVLGVILWLLKMVRWR